MSYNGTAATRALPPPSEYTNRVTTRQTREKQDYKRRVSGYEREYDSSVSGVSARQKHLRESMLAYTERIKNIAKQRGTDPHSGPKDELVVSVKQISKAPVRHQGPRKNRGLSFDQLLNRSPKSSSPSSVGDRKSESSRASRMRLSLPKLGEKIEKTLIAKDGGKIKVSLVSASDLCDIVDFSLRAKQTKDELIMEKSLERNQAEAPVHASLPPIQDGGDSHRKERRRRSRRTTKSTADAEINFDNIEMKGEGKGVISVNDCVDTSAKNINSTRRPRLKRMRLPKGTLDSIPEADSVSDSDEKGAKGHRQHLQLSNLYLVNSPRTLLATRPKLDSILEKEDVTSSSNHIPHAQMEKYSRSSKGGKQYKDLYDLNGHQLHSRLPPLERLPLYDPTANFHDDPNPLEILGKRSARHSDNVVKHEKDNTKVKAQKRYRKLLFLRDSPSLYDRLD